MPAGQWRRFTVLVGTNQKLLDCGPLFTAITFPDIIDASHPETSTAVAATPGRRKICMKKKQLKHHEAMALN